MDKDKLNREFEAALYQQAATMADPPPGYYLWISAGQVAKAILAGISKNGGDRQ